METPQAGRMAEGDARSSSGLRWPGIAPAVVLVVLWTILYVWRSLNGHASLLTNAYDLSMWDYALWNSLHGAPGFVPFIGHSLLSHHFTPVFWLLPLYAICQSPAWLIVLQVGATAGAGWLYYQFQQRLGLDRGISLALLAVFLLSRRTHGATTSVFYPECFQAGLTFAVVACWERSRWWYWTFAVLLLTTKEDAALYLGAFGLIQVFASLVNRRRAIATVVLCAVWAAAAFGAFVPMSRARDGLSTTNPLIESRFASEGRTLEPTTLVVRSLSPRSLARVSNLLATTGLLPILGWEWLGPAVPGIVVNSAAKLDTQQAALIDHYYWPVLPWLFMACAAGALKVQRRSLRVARLWSLVLLCGTLVDSPAVRGLPHSQIDPQATAVLKQLAMVDLSGSDIILAQHNLIPHLAHSNGVFAVGGERVPPTDADVVLVTRVGDLWPFSLVEIDRLVGRYAANPAYQQVAAGPLYAFRLRRPR